MTVAAQRHGARGAANGSELCRLRGDEGLVDGDQRVIVADSLNNRKVSLYIKIIQNNATKIWVAFMVGP